MLPSPGFFKRTHTHKEDKKQIEEQCAQHELLQGTVSIFSNSYDKTVLLWVWAAPPSLYLSLSVWIIRLIHRRKWFLFPHRVWRSVIWKTLFRNDLLVIQLRNASNNYWRIVGFRTEYYPMIMCAVQWSLEAVKSQLAFWFAKLYKHR